MIEIVDYHRRFFEDMFTCYQLGFTDGHNGYTLARLALFQRDTIFLAVNESGLVVGVLIGITSAREAWFTGLTLLPGTSGAQQLIARLAQALSHRFIDFGFDQARLTTRRRSILRFVERVKAPSIIEAPDCYHDGVNRWIVTVNMSNLPLLTRLIA